MIKYMCHHPSAMTDERCGVFYHEDLDVEKSYCPNCGEDHHVENLGKDVDKMTVEQLVKSGAYVTISHHQIEDRTKAKIIRNRYDGFQFRENYSKSKPKIRWFESEKEDVKIVIFYEGDEELWQDPS